MTPVLLLHLFLHALFAAIIIGGILYISGRLIEERRNKKIRNASITLGDVQDQLAWHQLRVKHTDCPESKAKVRRLLKEQAYLLGIINEDER